MIHDVDESLRVLAKRDALNGAQVEIAFDAPNKDWVSRRNAPTVDLYLYDIREDLQRREVAYEPVRNDKGIVTEHRPPARRFRLSYLVTAWTQRPEDEHRLLSAMLGCFIRHPALPADVLTGALADSAVPIYLTVALPPPQDRSLADVWSALGGELKPSLDLVVTAPLDANLRIDAAPPVLEHPRIRVVRDDGTVEWVLSGNGAAARRRGAGRLSPGESAAQEETVQAGAPTDPEAAGAGTGAAGRGRKGTSPDAASTNVPGRRIVMRGIPRP
jgi:hypothetical protein